MMGLIKEPEGVDFVIKSRPLTKKEQALLSKFIEEQKAKKSKRLVAKKKSIKAATLKRKKMTS